jgi:hypothetical protein
MGEKWTRCQLRSLKIVFQSTHGIAFSDDPDRVSESILSNYSQNTARSGANMFCLYQGLSGGTEFAVAARLDPLARISQTLEVHRGSDSEKVVVYQ